MLRVGATRLPTPDGDAHRVLRRAWLPMLCAVVLVGITDMASAAPIGTKSPCPLGEVSRAVAGPTPKSIASPKKLAWEKERGGKEAARPFVAARLYERPSRLVVDRHSLPDDEGVLAWRIARDTWRGLRAMTDKENGLPVDHITVGRSPEQLQVGDYTNVTNIGVHLISIVAAHELGLLAKDEAVAMVEKVLGSVERLEAHRGWLFNYYDTTSMERTTNFVSFVDSSWLTAGLIVVRSEFPELFERCSRLITRTNYSVFYDPKTRLIEHGYFVDPSERSPYDYGMLYTEARLGSLIAIGKGDVPREQWLTMARILPPGCQWQSLAPIDPEVRSAGGLAVPFGQYEWKGLRYVPSWGGSMFEALMPTLLLDETRHAPASLGLNGYQHAQIQERYAKEVLSYPVWGMSPSSTPIGDGYSEFGVPVLGVRGYAGGAVTPHASALALGVTPREAMANLHRLASLYDLYGEFGFYDAVEPGSGAVAHRYLSLDQSMLFIALANYLDDHCIQRIFAADPIVQKVLPLLAVEDALWLGNPSNLAHDDGPR